MPVAGCWLVRIFRVGAGRWLDVVAEAMVATPAVEGGCVGRRWEAGDDDLTCAPSEKEILVRVSDVVDHDAAVALPTCRTGHL